MTRGAPEATVEALIVSFNTRALLERCLTSLDANRPGGEIAVSVAVCDNGSTDGSGDMVARRFPAARLVRRSENLGFARANNLLATSSTADYVLLVNPDTVFVEDVITPLLRVLRSDPRIIVVGPRLVFPDGRVQTSSESFPGLDVEAARLLHGTRLGRLARPCFDSDARLRRARQVGLIDSRTPRDTDFLWATCWLIRRDDIPSNGLFDSRFSTYDEDLDFCRRQRDRGRRVVYVPEATLVHVGGQSSQPELKQRLERQGRARYYREHGGRVKSLAFRSLTAGFDRVRQAKHAWHALSARGAGSLTSRRRERRPAG
jgi:N-acetylglucosaminyl-diphospho-decaprenol L-rhamnosyltransferase